MSQENQSTRRAFLKGGALLATPLAIGAPAAAMAADDARERLARLEDEKAIRDLHQHWMRHINAGSGDTAAQLFAEPGSADLGDDIHALAPDHAGQPDVIEIAADGQHASGCFACTIETVTIIPPTSTLAQMAHAQGEGFVRETQQRLVKADYVKTKGGWAIAGLTLAEG